MDIFILLIQFYHILICKALDGIRFNKIGTRFLNDVKGKTGYLFTLKISKESFRSSEYDQGFF